MHSIRKDMQEFHGQLRNGAIQRAYRALLSYMMELRIHFKGKYPDSSVSALYQGYMDMTYFAVSPPSLKQRDLKIAIVFNYEAFRFEAWLSGRNRSVNRKYWETFKVRKWPAYRVVTPAKGVDSIVECEHYCCYCYALARAETDWSKESLIHKDIVKQLSGEIDKVSPQPIYMGYHTDPYQPCEAQYRQTRKVLELLKEKGFSASMSYQV